MFSGCTGCDSSDETQADTSPDVTKQKTAERADTTVEDQPEQDAASQAPAQQKASAETTESAQLAENPPLDIDGLLTDKDVEKMVGQGQYTAADLLGQEPNPSYNSIRFRPEDGNNYGAGLQVWKFEDSAAAQNRFGQLRNQYLDVSELPTSLEHPGRRAFVSERGGIRQLVVQFDRPTGIVALSCTDPVCKNNRDAVRLLRVVAERFDVNSDNQANETSPSDSKSAEPSGSEEGRRDLSGDSESSDSAETQKPNAREGSPRSKQKTRKSQLNQRLKSLNEREKTLQKRLNGEDLERAMDKIEQRKKAINESLGDSSRDTPKRGD